jgi:HEAT repeat protein
MNPTFARLLTRYASPALLIFPLASFATASLAAQQSPPAETTAAPPDSTATQPHEPLNVKDKPPRERAWDILHGALASDSAEKRAKAVAALVILKGNSDAEKLAMHALDDAKFNVRAAAATALGSMHALRSIRPLEAALDDSDPAVVLAAANSLMQLQDARSAYDIYYGVLTGTVRTNQGLVKEQLKTLRDKKKMAQLGLEQGIGFIPYAGYGYGAIKAIKQSDNSPVRAAAAKKLAHDPDPASAAALVEATHDKGWMVRAAALEAIAERGDRSLLARIKTSLDDDRDEVRYAAAACIARLESKRKRTAPPEHASVSTGVAGN